MPFIVPFIPLIVAGVGALTTGLQLAGVGQPSAHAGDAAAAANESAQKQLEQKNRVASIAQRLPDLQAQLGGTVSPDFLMAMAATSSGNPGDRTSAQIALNNWLGIDSGTAGPNATSAPSSDSGTGPTPQPTGGNRNLDLTSILRDLGTSGTSGTGDSGSAAFSGGFA